MNLCLYRILFVATCVVLSSCGRQNSMVDLEFGKSRKQVNVVDAEQGVCDSCQSVSVAFKVDQVVVVVYVWLFLIVRMSMISQRIKITGLQLFTKTVFLLKWES